MKQVLACVIFATLGFAAGRLVHFRAPAPDGEGPGSAAAIPSGAALPTDFGANGRLTTPDYDEFEHRQESSEALQARAEAELMAEIIGAIPWDSTPPPPNSTGEMLGDIPHGNWSIFHESNGATEMGKYFLGARWGTWRTFLDGRLMQEGPMVNSQRHGIWKQVISPPGKPERWILTTYVEGEPQLN
jgi:hypothetical protein